MIWFCFPNLNASTVKRDVVKIGRKHSTVNAELYAWLNLIGKVTSHFFLSCHWAVLTLPVYKEKGEGRNFLRKKFLRNLFLQFSIAETLCFAEQFFANCIQFLNVFFENRWGFGKKYHFLYIRGKMSGKICFAKISFANVSSLIVTPEPLVVLKWNFGPVNNISLRPFSGTNHIPL